MVAYNSDVLCSDCYTEYICNSRSDSVPLYFNSCNNWVCQECTAVRKQLLIENKINFLASLRTEVKKDLNDLSVQDLAYLVALIKHSSYEDGITVSSVVSDSSYLLTPKIELDLEVLKTLDLKNICIISDKNSLSNLQDNTSGGYTYSLYNILRDVWVEGYNGFSDLVFLEMRLINMANSNMEEFFQLLETVSVYECLAYIQLNLDKRSIYVEISERAHSLIRKMLVQFPVNIIWGIIFSSIMQTSDYILQNRGTFNRIAKISGACPRDG